MTQTFELNGELLLPPVSKLLGEHPHAISGIDIKALKPGAGNPTSLGVYRITGSAQVAGSDQPFSLVVKHLADGRPMMDASQPENWNYWRREIDFFESRIVERIPASIGFPKYLGASYLPDGSALFWNADLGDLEKSTWTWADCINAARLVAELNSIESSDLHEMAWLNRSQVKGWDDLRELWGTFTPVYQPLIDLALTKPETSAALEVFGPYMNRHDFIGQLLTSGRHSFVHGDFNLNNLVPVRNGDVALIALDWQLCGEARIGTEVAAIFNTAIEHKVIGPEDVKFDELCAVYTDHFNELNCESPISLRDVRLAAAAMGYFILQGVGYFFAQPQPDDTQEQIAAKVSGLLNEFATGPVMVYSRVLHELAPLDA